MQEHGSAAVGRQSSRPQGGGFPEAADGGEWVTVYDHLKKTVKHALIFGIGSLASSAYGLILVPLYVRYMAIGEYGLLALAMPALTTLTLILRLGLNHAFFRHYYDTEDPQQRRRLAGSTLIFLLLVSSVSTLVLWMLAPQISAIVFKGDSSRQGVMRLVFLINFFEIITLVPDSILRVKFQSGRYTLFNMLALAFQLLLIIYLVRFVDPTVNSVLTGRLAGGMFGALLFFISIRKELALSFDLPELREMLGFGVPLIFGQLGFTLFMMIDRYFVQWYRSKAEVGQYGMANQIVTVISVLVTVPFSQVWTVMRFKVMKEKGAEEYYSRVLTYIVLLSMLLALLVAAVAGDGLILKGLRGYWPAASVLPLLALWPVLDSAARVLNVGITLKKGTIYAPLVIAMALGVNVLLNILWIPAYGIMGATVATLLSYVVFCGLRYWASNLFIKVRYEWGRVFVIFLFGGALIAGFYLVDYLRGAEPSVKVLVASMLLKTALALSLPVALLVTGFFDEKERRRAAELIDRAGSLLNSARKGEEDDAAADEVNV